MRDVIHNLQLIQSYAEAQGNRFIFTVPPNKNTLYPEHMPYYYSVKVSDTHNRDLIRAALAESDINYVDLFELFEEQDEVLYFARDSHWNNKGAMLAADKILTALGKSHYDYTSAPSSRLRDFVGDLSKMIYPAGAQPEYNYYYGTEDRYSYVTDTDSVEDPRITTAAPDGTGRLYMYRDSFGNALMPFIAAEYEEATFSKAFPMILEADLSAARSDTFIMELVERNIDWLITRPPVIPSPTLSFYKTDGEEQALAELSAERCAYSDEYIQFTGTVDSSALDDSDILYLAVTDGSGETVTYECYGLSAEDGLTGFVAYAHADRYDGQSELDIKLVKQSGSGFTTLADAKVNYSGGNHEEN